METQIEPIFTYTSTKKRFFRPSLQEKIGIYKFESIRELDDNIGKIDFKSVSKVGVFLDGVATLQVIFKCRDFKKFENILQKKNYIQELHNSNIFQVENSMIKGVAHEDKELLLRIERNLLFRLYNKLIQRECEFVDSKIVVTMKILNPFVLFEKAQDYNSGLTLVDFDDELLKNLLIEINQTYKLQFFKRDRPIFKSGEYNSFYDHPYRTAA